MTTHKADPGLPYAVSGHPGNWVIQSIDTTSCATHQEHVQHLREYAEALRSVHPSDLDSPNVLDHVNVMGQLAQAIYVRQRVAALDGSNRVQCGEIWCCGGSADEAHLALVDRVQAELSVI